MPRSVFQIRDADPEQVRILALELGLPEVVARLLCIRGLAEPQAARRFLTPALADLDDPFLMQGMEAAVARLVEAMQRAEPVCIWGDYDVDGITSVTVLLLFLREVGLEVSFHIPSRMDDGYGLNSKAIEGIAAGGCRLLITVDCGISEIEHIAGARALGLDVIVIDHHQVGEQLPDAVAILNPHQQDCAFPTKDLAAVGVVFNLVMALRSRLRDRGTFASVSEPNLREYLDLVALGTVADIVPLRGENRIITHHGLLELTAGRRPGVAALKEVSGILNEQVLAGQVAFRLAPRINAVGRIGNASEAVELLTTRSYSRALELARSLQQANTRRQGIEHSIFLSVSERAKKRIQAGDRAVVLWDDAWHVGVIGIVASRLVDQLDVPVALIAMDGQAGRGSARSNSEVDLYQALLSSAQHLVAFGGHRAAAGMSVARDKLDDFREAFLQAVSLQAGEKNPVRIRQADAEIDPAILTPELLSALDALAPFGMGNPEPVFVSRGLTVKAVRMVGGDEPRHLKLSLGAGAESYEAIGFRMGDRLREATGAIDVFYTPVLNTWGGRSGVQLKLKDFSPAQM